MQDLLLEIRLRVVLLFHHLLSNLLGLHLFLLQLLCLEMMTDLASPFQDASNLSLAQHLQILEGLIQIIGSVLHQPIILCPFLWSHSDLVVFRKDKQRILSLYQLSQWDFLVEMHGGVVLISSSFSSGFKQLVNACDLSCELVMEVIGFGVLEDVLGIEELLVNEGRG